MDLLLQVSMMVKGILINFIRLSKKLEYIHASDENDCVLLLIHNLNNAVLQLYYS